MELWKTCPGWIKQFKVRILTIALFCFHTVAIFIDENLDLNFWHKISSAKVGVYFEENGLFVLSVFGDL